VYSPGTYLGYLLDFLTVFFLVKFTKKPLRFFGILGSGVFALGFLITLYLIAERLLGGDALANRPALILSSLLIILGIQVLAIGLIGEIIIFHTRPRDQGIHDRRDRQLIGTDRPSSARTNAMHTPTLMVQGTTSGAGKSTLVAAEAALDVDAIVGLLGRPGSSPSSV